MTDIPIPRHLVTREMLWAEIARLHNERNVIIEMQAKEIERLRAEVEMERENANRAIVGKAEYYRRVEKAETEIERLRDALDCARECLTKPTDRAAKP